MFLKFHVFTIGMVHWITLERTFSYRETPSLTEWYASGLDVLSFVFQGVTQWLSLLFTPIWKRRGLQWVSSVRKHGGSYTQIRHKDHTFHNGSLGLLWTVHEAKAETPSPTFYVVKQKMKSFLQDRTGNLWFEDFVADSTSRRLRIPREGTRPPVHRMVSEIIRSMRTSRTDCPYYSNYIT